MHSFAYAELPDYVITGNTFDVPNESIYFYVEGNSPYDMYDNAEIHYGGFLIDDNVFNNNPSYSIYFEISNFCYSCYDDIIATLGDVTITNNEFYSGTSNEAVNLNYYDVPYDVNDNASVQVGATLISGNVFDGVGYGVDLYYSSVDPSIMGTVITR